MQRKINQEKNSKNSGRGQEKNIEEKRYVAKAKRELKIVGKEGYKSSGECRKKSKLKKDKD